MPAVRSCRGRWARAATSSQYSHWRPILEVLEAEVSIIEGET